MYQSISKSYIATKVKNPSLSNLKVCISYIYVSESYTLTALRKYLNIEYFQFVGSRNNTVTITIYTMTIYFLDHK